MNEIEESRITIARLSENPVYQEYVRINNIIREGKMINDIIVKHEQYLVAASDQQRQIEQQQEQQQQQLRMNQQMMQQQQGQSQIPQRQRPMQKPQQMMPRQNVDSFGNPLTPEQNVQQKFGNTNKELGLDEAPIDGVPEWTE